MTTAVPIALSLDAWSAHDWDEGLQIDTLEEFARLAVRTRNSVYDIIVVQPGTGDVLIRGGRFFPAYTAAHVAGASLGGSFLKLYGIYVGFRVEIQFGGRTILTTRVRSVERCPGWSVQ